MNPYEREEPRATRLLDIVFPGGTNHHGTLFGGVGLSHMDKVAFITASRHAPVPFVTASCERIDFAEPARLGEIIELTGTVTKVGRRSLAVEVELMAEEATGTQRRRCTTGVFNMVAVGDLARLEGGALPPVARRSAAESSDGDSALAMVEMVFPDQTSHYGSLYGGNALAAMSKAAFIVATRHCREAVVMASAQQVDFTSQIGTGEIIELRPAIPSTGRSSMTVEVELVAENLRTGVRRRCGSGRFVMVAVGADHRPVPLRSPCAASVNG